MFYVRIGESYRIVIRGVWRHTTSSGVILTLCMREKYAWVFSSVYIIAHNKVPYTIHFVTRHYGLGEALCACTVRRGQAVKPHVWKHRYVYVGIHV